MTPITSGRMKIIPTLERDGWALPGGGKARHDFEARIVASTLGYLMAQDLTTEQRNHYIKNGGMGYAKHDA